MREFKVIVTGGTGALGRAVCKSFVERGARVASLDLRRLEGFLGALGGLGEAVVQIEADLGSPEGAARGVAEAAARLGGLDAICNVAGGFEMGAFEEFPSELMERMLTMNFRSAYHATRAAVPYFKRPGPGNRPSNGKIIFVGAKPALAAGPLKVAYAASKAAVLSMSRSLAAELLEDGIQVNAVIPSMIDTSANRASMPDADFSRWPRPEQIAEVIAWLCSPAASIVSGAEIPVYGRSA